MTDKKFILPFYAKVLLKPRGFLLGEDITGALTPSVMPAGFNRGELYKSKRSGNYSGLGYILMDGPLTEAEQWDMPFVNPVFEYESKTEG